MRSGSTSKETFCPSTSERMPEASTAEMCTKTSFAPSSGVMKPKPLVALKNFTVPVWAMGGNSFPVGVSASTRHARLRHRQEVTMSGKGSSKKRFQSPGLQPPERLCSISWDHGESKAKVQRRKSCSSLADLHRRRLPQESADGSRRQTGAM